MEQEKQDKITLDLQLKKNKIPLLQKPSRSVILKDGSDE